MNEQEVVRLRAELAQEQAKRRVLEEKVDGLYELAAMLMSEQAYVRVQDGIRTSDERRRAAALMVAFTPEQSPPGAGRHLSAVQGAGTVTVAVAQS